MYTNNRYHNYKNQQNERELINETIAALGWELNPEEEYEFSKLLQGLKDISKKVVYKAKPFAHAGMILAKLLSNPASPPPPETYPVKPVAAQYYSQEQIERGKREAEKRARLRKDNVVQGPPDPGMPLIEEIFHEMNML